MWFKEDNTFNDIRKRSVEQWLNDIEDNADLVVRGGVKVTREYIEYLENEIKRLKDENNLKNTYLKKAAGEKNCGFTTEEDFDFCPKCGERF